MWKLPGRGAQTREREPLTFRGILEIALGELHLHPEDFYEYSMEEFVIKVEGMRKAKMEDWYKVRFLAYTVAKPYMKNQKITPEQFMPLPGDVKTKKGRVAGMSAEERKQWVESVRGRLVNEGVITDN